MKKYASTRGSKSHGRDRCTLHQTHLRSFTLWLEAYTNWHVLPHSGHAYEVLHVQEFDRSGDGEHQFLYRRDRTEHLTVQYRLVPLVKKFLAERKANLKKNLATKK